MSEKDIHIHTERDIFAYHTHPHTPCESGGVIRTRKVEEGEEKKNLIQTDNSCAQEETKTTHPKGSRNGR